MHNSLHFHPLIPKPTSGNAEIQAKYCVTQQQCCEIRLTHSGPTGSVWMCSHKATGEKGLLWWFAETQVLLSLRLREWSHPPGPPPGPVTTQFRWPLCGFICQTTGKPLLCSKPVAFFHLESAFQAHKFTENWSVGTSSRTSCSPWFLTACPSLMPSLYSFL